MQEMEPVVKSAEEPDDLDRGDAALYRQFFTDM